MCFRLHKTACLLCGHVFLASSSHPLFAQHSTAPFSMLREIAFSAEAQHLPFRLYHQSWTPICRILFTALGSCRVSGSPSSFPFAHRCLDWFQSCDLFSFLLNVGRQRAFGTVCSRCKPSCDYRREEAQ